MINSGLLRAGFWSCLYGDDLNVNNQFQAVFVEAFLSGRGIMV